MKVIHGATTAQTSSDSVVEYLVSSRDGVYRGCCLLYMGSWWISEFSLAGRTPGMSGTWFMKLSRQVLKSLTIFLWSWGAPSFRRCGGRQLYSSTACLKKDDWCMSLSHFGVPLGNSLAMARRLFLVCRGAGIPGFGTK